MITRRVRRAALLGTACLLALAAPAAAQPATRAPASESIALARGDRIVLIGNTFAERMLFFPHLEVLLTALRPADSLTFRNLGWSGDEVALRPRPLGFGDLRTHLAEQRADVILAAFGMNESFAGAAGLPRFRTDLEALLGELGGERFNGRTPARIVLLSPIAQEKKAHVRVDVAARNRDLALYTAAMREVATAAGVGFVDLHAPTLALMAEANAEPMTINGIHLTDRGYAAVSRLILRDLGWMDRDPLAPPLSPARHRTAERLEARIREKNELFFLRWRAVNGEYIYGRRREPFGVIDFPPEMRQLEEMIGALEQQIWTLAREIR
jgi:hypothetical protein